MLEITCKMDYRLELEIALFGHLLNPLWKSRAERRRIRGEVTARAVSRHLDAYTDFIRDLKPETQQFPAGPERIFSIWLQGEQAAPELVKACWRSVGAHCPQELVVLDSESIFRWIDLPEHIVKKWREGKMRPAHFSDICRLALLSRYGGLWLDATDYIPASLPEWLWESDFFVYMSGSEQTGGWYAFIQNCFIRARAGNFLASAWFRLICEYWRREDRPVDYLIHQLLFKKLVENNALASELFSAMPRIGQEPTHELWFGAGDLEYRREDWDAICAGAMFQKTEYKSSRALSPIPGSNAYHLIHNE